MWMAFTQLNDREESFVVSPVVLHSCTIAIHPPSCSDRNSSSRKPISLLYTKARWITAAASLVWKIHKTSSCCPLSRPRLCKQGCLQVVWDLLTWVELRVVTSAWQSAGTTVLGGNPQLLSAACVGEKHCGSLWGGGGLAGWHLQSLCGLLPQPWLLAVWYVASVGGRRSRWQ